MAQCVPSILLRRSSRHNRGRAAQPSPRRSIGGADQHAGMNLVWAVRQRFSLFHRYCSDDAAERDPRSFYEVEKDSLMMRSTIMRKRGFGDSFRKLFWPARGRKVVSVERRCISRADAIPRADEPHKCCLSKRPCVRGKNPVLRSLSTPNLVKWGL